ncbi:MAG: TetR/AcrR family transcriptional regulator [Hyphomicrobiales bacterium]
MTTDTPRPYHHGALEEALVEHALAHVRAAGFESFSVRQAAREIGVSPGAAYRHFRTREELVGAVARRADRMLAAELAAARRPGASAAEDVLGIGLAYIGFARAEPQLFKLMFASPLDAAAAGSCGEPCGEAPAGATDETAFGQLQDTVRRFLIEEKGLVETSGAEGAARLARHCDFLWAVAHGIASLEAMTGWRRDAADLRALLEMGLGALGAQG